MTAAQSPAGMQQGSRADSLWTGDDDLDRARAAIGSFAETVRRHRVALIVWVALCAVTAGAYARSTTPEYLASVQLLLSGGHKAQDGPDDTSLSHQLELSGAEIETQLAVLRSPGLLQPVFDTLRLDAAPELTNAVASPVDLAATQAGDMKRRRGLFDAFRSRVGARRVGLSTTFEVSYRAPDPDQTVRVANAIAAAYVLDRVRTAMVDTRAFTPYLKTRIAAILTEAAVAAEAVRKGGLPDAEFVDADVRVLGPARMPLAPAYPRLGPITVLAIGFGLISGLLALAVLHHADDTIRSCAQLRHGFGIDAFGVAMEDGRTTPQATFVVLAAAMAKGLAPLETVREGDAVRRLRAIGIGSWDGGPAARLVGAGLAEVLRASGRPARLVDPEAAADPAATDPTQNLAAALVPGGHEEVAVVALPAFAPSFAARAVLPLLDAVVLVALAGRTTVPELRRALRAAGGGRTIPIAAVILVEPSPARNGTAGRRWWPLTRLTVGATHNNTLQL